jgi:hypothetical protein
MVGMEFTFKLLDRTYASRLTAINQACPIEADFTLIFERGEDFFCWPDLLYDQYRYLGAFFENKLIGYLMLGTFTGWTGNEFGTCGYLGDARVIPDFRGHKLTEQMMVAMDAHVPSGTQVSLVLIKKGNLPAESIAATAESTKYQGTLLGDFQVLNIPLLKHAAANSSVIVRNARTDDLEEMAQLFSRCNKRRLFAPLLSEERLRIDLDRMSQLTLEEYFVAERDGRLVGMLAAWDMHPFHFTRVLRYSFSGELLRAAYKMVTLMSPGSVSLPAPGGTLQTLTITRVAIEDQDAAVLHDLIAHLINVTLGNGYHLLSLGFPAGDPLIQSVQGFPLVQHFVSTLYCITRQTDEFSSGENPPYVDLAMI